MSEHTLGPWHCQKHSACHGIHTTGHGVAMNAALATIPFYEGVSGGEDEANARLITAAPELFWFTKQILESGGMVKLDSPADETLAYVIAKGRAAIAKARS